MADQMTGPVAPSELPDVQPARPGAAKREIHMDSAVLLETARTPLALLHGDLRVEAANAAFYEAFATTPEATEGRLFWELGSTQTERERLRVLLQEALVTHAAVRDVEIQAVFPALGLRRVRFDALRVEGADGMGASLLVFLEDVTPRREEALSTLGHASPSDGELLTRLAEELRHPLAPMILALDVLRLRSAGDPVVRRQREVLERQLRHMVRLINELEDGAHPRTAPDLAFRR